MRVTSADQVRIDERTDVREVICSDVDADCLAALEEGLANGTVIIEPGLQGWGHNVTLRDLKTDTAYHATIAED